jgi:hypothetical protein
VKPVDGGGIRDDLVAALARSGVTDGELAEIADAHSLHIVGRPPSAISSAADLGRYVG